MQAGSGWNASLILLSTEFPGLILLLLAVWLTITYDRLTLSIKQLHVIFVRLLARWV